MASAPAPLVAQRARLTDRACSDTLAGTATARRPAPPSQPSLTWRDGPVAWTEWPVQLGRRAVPVTVVVARFNPTQLPLALEIARTGEALGPWSIDVAPPQALVAFNAGQFTDDGPWGWVVHRGREWQAPGSGALAASIVVDSSHRVHIVTPSQASAWHTGSARGSVLEALQSYPQLLADGRLPRALCRVGAINRGHRDIRLALGLLPDGRVLVALTRYAPAALLPEATSRLPIGPTTLEMAEIMWRLGAVDAVMLDGGLSAQLLIRDATGVHRWPGLRSVPLAIVGTPR